MTYLIHRRLRAVIRDRVHGRTLDLGAGHLTYRDPLCSRGHDVVYVSVDRDRTHPDLDVRGDACRRLPFADAAFDTVFCSQVLEHVPDPQDLLHDAYRVLRPGGSLILTVPFLFYLHGLPHDYWRITPAGLELIARRVGFTEVATIPVGGGLAAVATWAFSLVFHALRRVPLPLLVPLLLCVPPVAWIDGLLNTAPRLPAAVILVARTCGCHPRGSIMPVATKGAQR
jgi:SAM-dependent methyltransferase